MKNVSPLPRMCAHLHGEDKENKTHERLKRTSYIRQYKTACKFSRHHYLSSKHSYKYRSCNDSEEDKELKNKKIKKNKNK